MSFAECAVFCIGQPGLVEQFDRLTGSHIAQMPKRSPLDAMVDKACGVEESQLAAFTAFVLDCVWNRLPPEAFTDETRTRLRT
jgi:hypothetical protein